MSQTRFSLLDLVLMAALVYMTTLAMYHGQAILMPLALAVIIANLLVAIANTVRRVEVRGRRLPPPASLAVAVAVLVLLGILIVDLITRSVGQIAVAAPEYQAKLDSMLARLGSLVGRELLTWKQLLPGEDLRGIVAAIVNSATTVVGSAVTIILYVVFLLFERGSISNKISALFPDPARETRVRETLDEIGAQIQKYIWLKTLVSLLTGVLSYLIMRAVGVDFAGFWALLIFLLNFVPYVGSLVAVVFPTLLTLIQFEAAAPFLTVMVLLTVVQLAVGNIVEPRIMGHSLNLSPLVILLSLAAWGTLWGVVGMVLSVPIMVMVLITLSGFEKTRPIAIVLSENGRLGR